MHDEQLRNTLSERFEGYSSPPSDAVWESIEKVLDEDDKAAGFRLYLLSPLVIGLLIGSSAAALALIVYFNQSETTGTLPLAEGGRPAHSQHAVHIQSTLSEDLPATADTFTPIPIQHHNRPAQVATPSEQRVERTVFVPEPIATRAVNHLETSSDLGFYGIYFTHIPSAECFSGGIDKGIPFPGEFYGNSGLTAQLLVSTFFNFSNASSAQNSAKTNTFNGETSDQYVRKNNRFVETELNFQGYFTKRIKGGLGLSLAYSNEEGMIDENTSYHTSQWSIGIPITLGMDVYQKGRFNLSVFAKLLNDFDQRKETDFSVQYLPNALSPELVSNVSISKDQVYRFGVQPMVSGSFYATPRTELCMSVSYRLYTNDSRTSSAIFQRTSYLGLSLGIGYHL
jgi:hypothetical protein